MFRSLVSCLAAVALVAIGATAEAQYAQGPGQAYAPPSDPGYSPAGTGGYPAQEPVAQPAPQPQPQPQPMYSAPPAAAPAQTGMKEMSGFLGPRLNIDFSNLESQFGTVIIPEIEGGIWIMNRAQIFLGFGTTVYGQGTMASDADDPVKARYGDLLLHLGARFNLTDPSPGRAYLYLGVDMLFFIGICKAEAGGEEDEEAEDIAKEQIDRMGFGPLLGVEFLVTDNFGFGAEAGLRLFINNLKETDPDNDYDYYREAYLEIPFALRLMYHF